MERLYGMQPAARIRAACVAVVGIGGVGSWAAEALARSGVGRLVLVDLDHIAESNVNRQIHALSATLGQAKVEAMRERIAQINPDCRVETVDDFVDPQNWPALLPAQVDAVIDACDDAKAKLTMAVWSLTERKRKGGAVFVTVGAAGGKRRAQAVELADLSLTTHDPLLAQLRYRLRKEYGAARDGKSIGIDCVFSREAVAPPDPSCAIDGDGSLNCHGFGSAVSVTATFGMVAAGHVIEKLAGRAISPL
ncbi:tRNA threonylcarbamoyladenosine dehydratase [Xylophilus rhododendri]|uniref:tRNA threonylcarbamoyladenosine dehydratase n=1 Tax=Xylophilus rhododendri TaxID=2697032 RepID=A0A857JBK2_9BURK|nr:tRNA threonylcarbamoyladenosine dehydratase [Xylophilus rhododendri]QHJ01391.1 tRNA threonylcarbamoyladenosine dehydratase [Xylophilus rhododendri]